MIIKTLFTLLLSSQIVNANTLNAFNCSKSYETVFMNSQSLGFIQVKDQLKEIKSKITENRPVKLVYKKNNNLNSEIYNYINNKKESKITSFIKRMILKSSISSSFRSNQSLAESYLNNLVKEGNNVVLISHGTGNLVANKGCLMIEPEFRNFVKNIQISTPTESIICGDKSAQTNINSDEFLFALKSEKSAEAGNNETNYLQIQKIKQISDKIPTSSFSLNITQNKSDGELIDLKNHSLFNYLSYKPSLEKIKKDFNSANNFFTSNQKIAKIGRDEISCENVVKKIGDNYLKKKEVAIIYPDNKISGENVSIVKISELDNDHKFFLVEIIHNSSSNLFQWIIRFIAFLFFIIFFPQIMSLVSMLLKHQKEEEERRKEEKFKEMVEKQKMEE